MVTRWPTHHGGRYQVNISNVGRGSSGNVPDMDDFQFRQILTVFNRSWSGYRRVRKGVKKRLRREMQQAGCRTIRDFLDRIRNDPAVRSRCESCLSVSISRFFRDPPLWEALQRTHLPSLAAGNAESALRAWSAGCGCGEEAYSLRMAWEMSDAGSRTGRDLLVTGTDREPEYLTRCRRGIYPAGSLARVPRHVRAKFFQPAASPNHMSVAARFRKNIRWRAHDLTGDPGPGAAFHLVFLRNNLLTYYQDPERIHAFRRVWSALAENGVLIIGKNESLPEIPPGAMVSRTLSYVWRRAPSHRTGQEGADSRYWKRPSSGRHRLR